MAEKARQKRAEDTGDGVEEQPDGTEVCGVVGGTGRTAGSGGRRSIGGDVAMLDALDGVMGFVVCACAADDKGLAKLWVPLKVPGVAWFAWMSRLAWLFLSQSFIFCRSMPRVCVMTAATITVTSARQASPVRHQGLRCPLMSCQQPAPHGKPNDP